MKKVFLIFSILMVSLSFLSCNPGNKEQTSDIKPMAPAFDMQKARSFIDSINQKFTEQFKNGDSVSLASHYGPDAEMLFAKQEPIKGKDILSTWGSWIRDGIKNGTRNFIFTTTDLTGDANFLIETGTYEMKDEEKNVKDHGKYVVIWKQENGQWKLYRDIGI